MGTVGAEPRRRAITGSDGMQVVFWPLAYTDPETARRDLGRDDIRSHEAVLRAHLDARARAAGDDARNVVVAHAFVTGGAAVRVRAPAVGGRRPARSRATSSTGFDYVALGHLHRPQRVGERVRYAGSLLKYSFDEADHRKSVSVVDIDAAGALDRRGARLPVRRDLVRLRGALRGAAEPPDAAEYAEAYVEVLLTDTDPVLDPMQKLRAVYPNILSLRREAWLGRDGVAPESLTSAALSTRELFGEFFRRDHRASS